MSLFLGYYDFFSPWLERIDGYRLRAEIHPLPAAILDVEVFEDDRLNDTGYFVGARFSVPFDVREIRHGRNPFAGARDGFRRGKREFKDRMTEMIMRDYRIQTKTFPVVGVREEVEKRQDWEDVTPDKDDDPPPQEEP